MLWSPWECFPFSDPVNKGGKAALEYTDYLQSERLYPLAFHIARLSNADA
jgi:hypothetical protein